MNYLNQLENILKQGMLSKQELTKLGKLIYIVSIDQKKNTDYLSFKIQTRNNLKSKQKISVKDNHKTLLNANKGYKYIHVIICIFSKKVIAIPLKSKKGLEVANAFSKMFEERIMLNQKLPKNLHVDKGKEFYNKDLEKILIKYNINMYSTYTNKKSSIIERYLIELWAIN